MMTVLHDLTRRREAFIREIANLTLEGEDDGEGGEYVWENDDAWATLYSLIEGARALVQKESA